MLKRPRVRSVILGMFLGQVAGALVGLVLGNAGVWAGFGLGIGLLLGVLYPVEHKEETPDRQSFVTSTPDEFAPTYGSHGDRVALSTFAYRHEAEMVRQLLRANGIEAYLVSDDTGGMSPGLTFTRGATLLVDIHDRDAASQVLAGKDDA